MPVAVIIMGALLGTVGDIIFAIAVVTMQDSWRAGITQENLETEYICCAISNNKDCQVMSKKAWLNERLNEGLIFLKGLEKCMHRAELGISVQKKYWGYGIGSHIMTALLDVAGQAGYKQVELEVATDNERAIALYEKFGFRSDFYRLWYFHEGI